ncbi:MAG: hypothetical protein J6K75_08920 [Erysipelotrichaceae bacterium]|nr:hypothetical protein [Erysipelotrichaceae bacterium]
MNQDKLYISFERDNFCCRINLCDDWEKIHRTLRKHKIDQTLYSIYMDDKNFSFALGPYSCELYQKISELISPTEQLATIHILCKFLKYGDQQFAELLPYQIDTYESVRAIEDDYRDFVDYKLKHMSTEEKKAFIEDRLNRRYQPLKLFGKSVLFTEERIPDSQLPDGIYRYEVRHDDLSRGIMSELSKNIVVNYWGTILSRRKIPLGEDGTRIIVENEDIDFLFCPSITLQQYIDEYPSRRKEHEKKNIKERTR